MGMEPRAPGSRSRLRPGTQDAQQWGPRAPVSGWGHTVGLSPGVCGGTLSPLQVSLFSCRLEWGEPCP